MSTSGCLFSEGLEIFRYWVLPETTVQENLGLVYKAHPVMSRIIATPVAAVSGSAKVLLFPLITLVGLVTMPFAAIGEAYNGDKREAINWLQAWTFCLLGFSASLAFLAFTGYCLPLIGSTAIFVSVVALSIIFHVHLMVKEPIKN